MTNDNWLLITKSKTVEVRVKWLFKNTYNQKVEIFSNQDALSYSQYILDDDNEEGSLISLWQEYLVGKKFDATLLIWTLANNIDNHIDPLNPNDDLQVVLNQSKGILEKWNLPPRKNIKDDLLNLTHHHDGFGRYLQYVKMAVENIQASKDKFIGRTIEEAKQLMLPVIEKNWSKFLERWKKFCHLSLMTPYKNEIEQADFTIGNIDKDIRSISEKSDIVLRRLNAFQNLIKDYISFINPEAINTYDRSVERSEDSDMLTSLKAKVLIIDDEEDIHRIYAYALPDCEIEHAYNGEDAKEKLTNYQTIYDVILLDLNLEKGNRYQDQFGLLEEIEGYSVPIIVMTSQEDIQSASKVTKEGADMFYGKSNYRPNIFRKKIKKVIDDNQVNARIFLLYSDNDIDVYNNAIKRIRQLSKKTWDSALNLQVGNNIRQEAINELEKSDSVVAFLSEGFFQNELCVEVLKKAVKLERANVLRILPYQDASISLFNHTFLENIVVERNLSKLEQALGQTLIHKTSINEIKKKYEHAEELSWTKVFLAKKLAHRYGQIRNTALETEYETEAKRLEFELRYHRNKEIYHYYLERIKVDEVAFFKDIDWKIESDFNVLLGKNGYGKSFLLQLVAILLTQENREKIISKFFNRNKFSNYAAIDFTRIELSRKDTDLGEIKQTSRNALTYEKTIGKIPILAISDLRYLDRANEQLGKLNYSDGVNEQMDQLYYSNKIDKPLDKPHYSNITNNQIHKESDNILDKGAFSLIHEQPEENRIRNFYAAFGKRWLKEKEKYNGDIKTFPLTQLICRIIRQLSEDSSFEIVECDYDEDADTFKIDVINENYPSKDDPLSIHKVSRGMTSVIGMFGIIYIFLDALRKERTSTEDTEKQHGIVLIDEIDAHLHPSWQQQIVSLLRRTFPKVQFIVSAHSPLVVAGCHNGEVAVLREDKQSFYIDYVDTEGGKPFFLMEIDEIYSKVFGIREIDISNEQLYYYWRADRLDHIKSEAKKLANIPINELAHVQKIRLKQLKRELEYIRLATYNNF